MSNLNEQQLAHLKELLQQREQALRADIHREVNDKDDYLEVATEAPDPGDTSFADLTVDLENAAVSRDLGELRAIEAAYGRMQDGTYGECVDCETDIPYERLEVQPMAERCAPCQEAYEKTHVDAIRSNTI
ncbi:TraR/DksA family transcriptional regulator [Oxalobacteraceae bacterium OM1]|nr:TraR/DksA family transcriptional regulator [Oxalobacteraceae bacterium OM1]